MTRTTRCSMLDAMHVRYFALAFVALPMLACLEKGPPSSKVDKAYVQANVLTAPPAKLDSTLNINFDGKIVYLGNQIGTKRLTPGGAGSIVHYWKVVQAPGPGWRIFTHLNGEAGHWMNLDATDMRTGYPSKKWKAGDVIRDEQKFSLASNWTGDSAIMSVGLYRKGGQGVDARMPILDGPKDAERRAPIFTFSVSGATKPKSEGASYLIRKASGPIAIDGKADEESWKNAAMSPNFSDTEGGLPVGAKTVARLLWDDDYLYAFIQVEDRDIFSEYHKQDDPLWKQDVVELFVDADSNRKGYIELQVNPNNAHFDAWFPIGRAQKHYFEWTSKMKSAVMIHGTTDNRGDRDQGWDVEIAIPLADVKGMDLGMKVTLPPALGDHWRLNVVRGEKPAKGSLAAASWNPITVRDFHALGRMLTVVFADSEGKTSKAAKAADIEQPPASERPPETFVKPASSLRETTQK